MAPKTAPEKFHQEDKKVALAVQDELSSYESGVFQ
jgi:hypothetical protein